MTSQQNGDAGNGSGREGREGIDMSPTAAVPVRKSTSAVALTDLDPVTELPYEENE